MKTSCMDAVLKDSIGLPSASMTRAPGVDGLDKEPGNKNDKVLTFRS